MAAHNSGGIVIVQVERLVAPGTLHARLVHLPGAIVDKVHLNASSPTALRSCLLGNMSKILPFCTFLLYRPPLRIYERFWTWVATSLASQVKGGRSLDNSSRATLLTVSSLQIVVAPAELHRQTITMTGHDASLTGEIRAPASHIQPMPLDERRIIGHRAMLEISRPHCIVNLGIGMPEAGPNLLSKVNLPDACLLWLLL